MFRLTVEFCYVIKHVSEFYKNNGSGSVLFTCAAHSGRLWGIRAWESTGSKYTTLHNCIVSNLYINALPSGSITSQALTSTRLFLSSFLSLHQWPLIYWLAMSWKNYKSHYLLLIRQAFLPVGERWRQWASWVMNHSPEGVTMAFYRKIFVDWTSGDNCLFFVL